MSRLVSRDDRTPLAALTPPPYSWAQREGPGRSGSGDVEATVTPTDGRESQLRVERVGLLARTREALRTRHYSRRTERSYVGWIGRFLCSLPREMPPQSADVGHVTQFLSRLAIRDQVAASTQNQAFSALLFLFRAVLEREVKGLDQVARAKRPTRVPQVLTRAEVSVILDRLQGTPGLMASLMYGCGLRLLECCRLRVKDIDFARGEITVRDGKGAKDRVTMLPGRVTEPLRRHLDRTRKLHEHDLAQGLGAVALPHAFDRKSPKASRQWVWQWVFPAQRFHLDETLGDRRRHHLHESVVQRAFKEALEASGIPKRASCHTLRHYAGCRIMPGGIADRRKMGGPLAA